MKQQDSVIDEFDNSAGPARHQTCLIAIVTNKTTETVLSILVLVSIALAVVEADKKAIGHEVPIWLPPIEHALLVVYSVEMSLRVCALRCQFFLIPMNVIELGIVLIDVIFALTRLAGLELPQVSFLRVLRLMKLARAFKILEAQPQLRFFMEAFASALRTMFFGWFFIVVALVVYGILAVEFLNPLKPEFSPTCTRCPEAFMSVYEAMAALFQTVIMGDEWAEVFRPYLAEYPATLWLIFPMFVTLNLGFLNLIMAGIVDSANQAREQSFKKKAQEREQEYASLERKFRHICREMDKDHSGSVTLPELMKGYDEYVALRTVLDAMDIKKQDLVAVFEILDKDGSGDVEYDEFVNELHKMRSSDSHTMLVFIKHYVTDLQKTVNHELMRTQTEVAGGIAKLHEMVNDQLKVFKGSMDMNEQLLEAADRRIEASIETEKHMLAEDIANHEQLLKGALPAAVSSTQSPKPPVTMPCVAATAMPLPVAASVASPDASASGQNLATYSQLRIASEQIGANLEELRRKCEQSAALLTTFCSALPHSTKSTELSLRNVNASQTGYQEKKQTPEGYWTPQSCCSAPLRHSRLGLPAPEPIEFAGPNSNKYGVLTESNIRAGKLP